MLKLMYFLIPSTLLVHLVWGAAQDDAFLAGDFPEDLQVCRLDIGFVLDGSGSVGADNWQRTLDFVKNLMSRLNMDPINGNRFGVVSFGNAASLNIGMNDYDNMADILDAVDRVRYLDENTNTAAGLRVMRTQLFDPTGAGERGDRPEVQNVAIVVTDGASTRETTETIPEAERARDDDIMMFALGIGPRESLNEEELMAIVGQRADHLYYLVDFEGLMGSVEDILRASCQIPTTTSSTTTTPHPLDNPCDNLDIVFLLDASGSIEDTNFQRIRKFARDFVSELTIGPEHTQVSVVSYSTYAKMDFNLTTFQSLPPLLEAMETLPWWNQMTNTSGALRIAQSQVFGTEADRLDAPDLTIVLTDGQSNRDGHLVPQEAGKLHQKGVKVMAVGAGKDVNMQELYWISSEPQYYYTRMFPVMRNLNDNFREMFFHICTPDRPLLREVLDHRLYPVDLALVFDDGDLPLGQYQSMVNFMVAVASELFYGPAFHQIAVATTSGGPNFPLAFDDFENRDDILNIIQFLQRREGSGNLAVTLDYVRYNIFNSDRGDRINTPNVAVIITAGFPNYQAADIAAQAARLREDGVLVLLVTALPLEVDFREYLIGIPNDPTEIYWFEAFNYPDHSALALALLQAISMSYARVEWECSFEQKAEEEVDEEAQGEDGGEKTVCGITQEPRTDQFDWDIGSGTTPSRHTGPSAAYSGAFYMFIEASKPREPGDTATMYLPFFPDREENWCMAFYYHMHGHHIGSLQVVLCRPGTSDDIRWMKNGPQGDHWRPGYVSLHVKPGYQIAVRAIRGEAFSGDIAVDNLQISRGVCPGVC